MATNPESTQTKKTTPLGYILVFIAGLLIARVIVDLVQHGFVFNPETWTQPHAWLTPLGFALIGCYAYWYRNHR